MLHVELLGAFVFGVVMAILYMRTRTLLIPIACHMLNNVIAVAFGAFSLADPSSLEELQSMLWLAVTGLIIATPILFLYIRRAWVTLANNLPYFDDLAVPAPE